jgi:HSP20 family protein
MNDNQLTENNQQENQNVQAAPVEQAATTHFVPLVDVIENREAFIFQADVPGVKAADLDVGFENGVLTIDAKVQPRQLERRTNAWTEYGVGNFYRQFTLRTPIDAAGITAELKNGELTITAPKADSAKARKIEVQST